MKIVYRGRLSKRKNNLSAVDLPQKAKPLYMGGKKNDLLRYLALLLIIIVLISVSILILIAKRLLLGGSLVSYKMPAVPLILLLLCILPVHELIHVLCFPKAATVEVCSSLNSISLSSTYPISKRRYILVSLCPAIILSIIPLII